MPRDKTATHNKIMPVIRAEFMEKGYEKASLREIAAKAGVSPSGLYRHFKDKEAMFEAVLEPFVKSFYDLYHNSMKETYAMLGDQELFKFWEFSEDKVIFILDFIYDHFDEIKLIMTCSEGTKYEQFRQELINYEVQGTVSFLEEVRRRGFTVRAVTIEELQVYTTTFMNAMFEPVLRDYSREEAERYIKIMVKFLYPGWKEAFGF